jgi:alpha-beta hydrolase superfamily lysophospholipase
MQRAQKTLTIDGEQLVCEFLLRDKNAVIIHGAGQARRQRYYAIADELLSRGIGVVLFDFSGHGESTGELKELSLARRQKQATAVIDHFVPPSSSLYLIGSSMGAQTLCDVLPHCQTRNQVAAILLLCPAIYAAAVHDLLFGNPEFTSILRTPNSWESSLAPGILQNFPGKIVIARGTADEVISPAVINLLKNAAHNATLKEYEGVTHQLAVWLGEHPDEAAALIDELIDLKPILQ